MATPTGLKRKPQNLDEAHLRALLAHRPTRLPLPHALLVVGSEGLITDADQAEWARLLGPGLEVMNAPGDHMSMIRAPNVAALVQRLEAWLRA
jgi:thioesterase domain-containing protein